MIKARDLSKLGKIFAGLFVMAMVSLKGLLGWDMEVGSIIKAGLTVVAITGPIDISIWLDKLRDK